MYRSYISLHYNSFTITDESIGWVQCGQCELWFHFACIGVPPTKQLDDEEYYCVVCEPAKRPPSKVESEDNYDSDDYMVCEEPTDITIRVRSDSSSSSLSDDLPLASTYSSQYKKLSHALDSYG